MSRSTAFEAIVIKVDGNIPITMMTMIRRIARPLAFSELSTGSLSSGSVQKVRRTMDR